MKKLLLLFVTIIAPVLFAQNLQTHDYLPQSNYSYTASYLIPSISGYITYIF